MHDITDIPGARREKNKGLRGWDGGSQGDITGHRGCLNVISNHQGVRLSQTRASRRVPWRSSKDTTLFSMEAPRKPVGWQNGRKLVVANVALSQKNTAQQNLHHRKSACASVSSQHCHPYKLLNHILLNSGRKQHNKPGFDANTSASIFIFLKLQRLPVVKESQYKGDMWELMDWLQL